MQVIQESFAVLSDRLKAICNGRNDTKAYLLESHSNVLEDPKIWQVGDETLPSKTSPIGNLPADASRARLLELSSGNKSVKNEIDTLIGQIAKSVLAFFYYIRAFADNIETKYSDHGKETEFQTSDAYVFKQEAVRTGHWATPLREVSSITDCDGNNLTLTSVHNFGDDIESLEINGTKFVPSDKLNIDHYEYSDRV
ncbi:MAG: hypothetical protein OXU45_08995 [Candidatus Melainabacteria bacterium]|nr:hypothetical protein [Candidatus Melainabacteria bacterium]